MNDFPRDPVLTGRDLSRLRALRARFLGDASSDYWREALDVDLYDRVFAQRIGWKWDAALEVISRTGWKPGAGTLLDWGCGSGVASRTVTRWCQSERVLLFDQSRLAVSHALQRARAMGHDAHACARPETGPDTLLVVSHVIGELNPEEMEKLSNLAAMAGEVIWVEPGTHLHSRRLSAVRDFLAGQGHTILAPCTRDGKCPMLEAENERHWCHFFAPPPPEVFQSAFWRQVSEELEIDLRALPFSFFASSRLVAKSSRPHAGGERLIGHPVEGKGHARLLCCGRDGLNERVLQKREAPDVFKQLVKKGRDGVIYFGKQEDAVSQDGWHVPQRGP